MKKIHWLLRHLFLFSAIMMIANGCTTTYDARFPASNPDVDEERDHYLPGTFRYAIWNFHRPEIQGPDIKTDAGKAAVGKFLIGEVQRKAAKYPQMIPPAVAKKVIADLTANDNAKLKLVIGGMKKIYGGLLFAAVPAENKKIEYINANKAAIVAGIDKMRAAKGLPSLLVALNRSLPEGAQGFTEVPDVPMLKGVESYTPAQRRFRAMMLVARGNNTQFFQELRAYEPVFHIPGDAPGKPGYHPLFFERNNYMVTRDADVLEGLGNDVLYKEFDATTDYFSQTEPPAYNTVIYTDPMDKVVHGPFMLAGEGGPANKEKPGLHKVVNRRRANDGSFSIERGQREVRAVVRRATMNALKRHTKAASKKNSTGPGTLDVSQFIARHIPMTMVSEYFGFHGPDIHTQNQWSRGTQHAFFHDALDLKAFDRTAIQSGVEMNAYIGQYLLPELKEQLKNGRPAYDTMGMMLEGHAGLDHTKFPGMDKLEERFVTNTMGLLVGAGETTSIAIANIMYVLTLPENKAILEKAVRLAKELKYVNGPKENEPLDRIVWEALRMKPMNPWVERYVTTPYNINASREDGRGSMSVDLQPGGKVYLSTHSAMHDSARFPASPMEFKDDRDLGKYIHMSVNYHRCLGDDVSLAMVPEMVKTMLANLNGLENRQGEPMAPSGIPFHEYFVLNYRSKDAAVDGPADRLWKARKLMTNSSFSGSKPYNDVRRMIASAVPKSAQNTIKSYLKEMDQHVRMVGHTVKKTHPQLGPQILVDASKPVARFDIAKFMELESALDQAYEAMIADSGIMNNCWALSVETIAGSTRHNDFCKATNIPNNRKFAVCYLVHRGGGMKTPVAAFNHCAYGKKLLSADSVKKMANIFVPAGQSNVGSANFYFLKHQL